MDHDGSYKALFTHPALMADLLTGFIQQPWVAQCDFASLEKRNSSFVGDNLKQRSTDLVWCIRCGEEYLYLYLLLEFQSTVDTTMAVRIMTYVGLLYQELLASREISGSGRLPPVLPIVLYNGHAVWTAPLHLAELVHPAPEGLAPYQPQMGYWLLDEKRYNTQELMTHKNLVAAIFALEQSQHPSDLLNVVVQLQEWLSSPAQASLSRAFVEFIKHIIIQKFRLPGATATRIIESNIDDLQDVRNNLQTTVNRRNEAIKILLCLLDKKFGPVNNGLRETIQAASLEQIEQWIDHIFQATSAEELVNRTL